MKGRVLMRLRLLIGASGSGKTQTIENALLACAQAFGTDAADGGRVLLLVPEQINQSRQKSMAEKSRGHVLFGVDILNFKRLAYHVLQDVGMAEQPQFDDISRNMLLYKIVRERADDLQYYGKGTATQGYIAQLRGIFTEFVQYQITDEQIDRAIAQASGDAVRAKLTDLKLLFGDYRQSIGSDLLDTLAERLPQSTYLDHARVYLDDFFDFTPQEMRVIAEMLRKCDEVIISIPMHPRALAATSAASDSDIYAKVRDTYRRLREMAEGLHAEITEEKFENEQPTLFESLSMHFFDRRPQRLTDAAEVPVHLREAVGRNNEIETVCKQILRLVQEEGYDYRDIAIAVGDLPGYVHALRNYGALYDLPFFMDERRPVLSEPLIRMILSLLQMMRSGCNYDSFLSFLRTGFSPLTKDQIDRLDNEALARGIRSFDRFAQTAQTLCGDAPNEAAVRDYFALLQPMFERGSMKKSTREWCAMIRRLLAVTKAEEISARHAAELEAKGFRPQAMMTGRIVGQVNAVLDRMEAQLPEENVRVDEFHGRLGIGFGAMQLGVLPEKLDQITVGDLERSRYPRAKALFIVGLDESAFPRGIESHGVFSEKERAQMEQTLPIGPSGARKIRHQQFIFQKLLSIPTEHLFVSYDASSEKGEKKLASMAWPNFEKLLGPGVHQPWDGVAQVPKKAAFREYLASAGAGTWDDRTEWFSKNGFGDLLKQVFAPSAYQPVQVALWDQETMTVSFSRMESFVQCPYQHFLTYGLKLKKRETYEADAASDGTILHQIMEGAGRTLRQGLEQNAVPDVDRCVQEMLTQAQKAFPQYQENAKNRADWLKLQIIAGRALTKIKEQIAAGEFQPSEFEWQFGRGPGQTLPPVVIPIDDTHKVELVGTIDRVDLYDDGDTKYVRVIDYKSHRPEINMGAMLAGLQLQLPVYMEAVLQNFRDQGTKARPAGMFYLWLRPRLPAFDSTDTAEEIEENYDKARRLVGFFLDDRTVLEKMSGSMDAFTKLVKAEIRTDGQWYSRSAHLARSDEDLARLTMLAKDRYRENARAMMAGCNHADPIRDVCQYCDYRRDCYFDSKKATRTVERWNDGAWYQLQRDYPIENSEDPS